jgi:hypothetical protein
LGEKVEEETHLDLFIDGPPLFMTGFPGRNLSITILFSFSDPNLGKSVPLSQFLER